MLTPVYPHAANPAEGVFNQKQAKALTSLGVECTVMVCKPRLPEFVARSWSRYKHLARLSELESDGAIATRVVRHWQVPGYRAMQWTVADCARQILQKIPEDSALAFDLIHAQSVYPVGLAARQAAAALGIPFLVTLHIADDDDLMRGRGAKLYQAMLRDAAAVVAVGSPLERAVRPLMPRQEQGNVSVVPNGVEMGQIEAPVGAIPAPGKGNRLVSIGNLWKLKGIDDLLNALAALDQRGLRDWGLSIVGEGPERGALEALARERRIADRVTFRGALAHPEALAEIMRADIFVLPSWSEAFGVVYLEAMACGKPAVGCRGQGAADIIQDGVTGLLVEPRDPQHLANALERLLRDPSAARQMGQAGWRVAREFTWARNAERYRALYEKILAEQSA